MKLQIIISGLIVVFIAGVLLYTSCGPTLDPQQIETYHNTFSKTADNCKSNDSTAVYIDYSDGMHDAIRQGEELVKLMVNATNKKEAHYFKVGRGLNKLGAGIEIYNPNNPAINPTNAENFRETSSDLDEAIAQIVKTQDRESVFITDFELFKNGSPDPNPWATRNFAEWFQAKGTIDVFAKPFVKSGNQQHLYALVFTPYAMLCNENANSLRKRLKKEGYMETTPKNEIQWFSFGFGMHTTTINAGESRFNDNLAPNDMSEHLEKKWDYYDFSYADLDKIITESTIKEKWITQKLYYNQTACSFDKLKFNLKVEDISNALGTKNAGKSQNNVFSLNENDLATGKNEIKVSLHPDFVKKQNGALSVAQQLFKVEVWLESAEPKLDIERQKEVLEWNDGTRQMSALNQSLTDAIKQNKFPSVLLHTYYLNLIN